MRYPNPTFLQKASGIRHTRRNRTLIIIGVLLTVTLICVFVSRVAAMQDKYREKYPDLVGAATSTADPNATPTPAHRRTGITLPTTESTTETTESTTEPTETTEPPIGPVIQSEDPTETAEPDGSEATVESGTVETDADGNPVETTETQNNAPDPFVEAENNFYFYNTHPLQTVSHEQRDIMLDNLKQEIQDYINNTENERICFRYISLLSNEELGINELAPIVPAGSYALPVLTLMWERASSGQLSLTGTATYAGGTEEGHFSSIVDEYSEGKQFYTRTLAYLAAARGDNLALNFIIEKLGGIEKIVPLISEISSYISFTSPVIYTDYSGLQQTGTNRSSLYDMTNFAAYLYHGYINSSDTYQYFLNDLAASEMPTAFGRAFGGDTRIIHCSGRNDQLHAYTDIAIIDCEEPIVLAVYCECESADRAETIQADIATYVSRFITACHS